MLSEISLTFPSLIKIKLNSFFFLCYSVIQTRGSKKSYKKLLFFLADKDGKEYIARGCLPPATIGCSAIANTIGWISSNTDQNGLRNLNCETCTTDKCNSAQKVTGMALIALIVSAFAFLL